MEKLYGVIQSVPVWNDNEEVKIVLLEGFKEGEKYTFSVNAKNILLEKCDIPIYLKHKSHLEISKVLLNEDVCVEVTYDYDNFMLDSLKLARSNQVYLEWENYRRGIRLTSLKKYIHSVISYYANEDLGESYEDSLLNLFRGSLSSYELRRYIDYDYDNRRGGAVCDIVEYIDKSDKSDESGELDFLKSELYDQQSDLYYQLNVIDEDLTRQKVLEYHHFEDLEKYKYEGWDQDIINLLERIEIKKTK